MRKERGCMHKIITAKNSDNFLKDPKKFNTSIYSAFIPQNSWIDA
jgi:hypothetical protein